MGLISYALRRAPASLNFVSHPKVKTLRTTAATLPRVAVALSVFLFVASLTRNSFCVPGGCNLWPAWGVLLMGWFEPVAVDKVGPFVALAWYANPCVVAAWVFVFKSKRRWAAAFSTIALILALGFLLGKSVLVSESGFPSEITGYGSGYWIWISSIAVALGAAILCQSAIRNSPGATAR